MDKNFNDIDKENEKYRLDHEYDGIKELDYPLPNWWVLTFIITSIFGAGYLIYYNFAGGIGERENFQTKRTKIMEIKEKHLEMMNEFDLERYQKIAANKELVELGNVIYQENCYSCHGVNGAGDVGPNLSDYYWLYSEGEPELVYSFIVQGSPGGGMPTWGHILSKEEIYYVTAFVKSLKGFPHKKAKAPQGEYYPEGM